ncbi:RNA-binding post-transcriptional regulator cip2 [Pleurostoma richardsiae]|uniref:RNA-binding post-transcriptional regulator cip2 n=1 Tax=Pleurostoma richardsiae TaxID=41990 RepID=A0AA38R2L5_9PEZI|nr:RNA-binding post-transcriptional regulator cip2 [Pleurostoma richardsiae]
MNQQQDNFYAYPNDLNRSPSSRRQGYATTVGLPSALGGGRPSQRQLDSVGRAPSSMYTPIDDRFGAFDTVSRYDQGNQNSSGMQGGFMLGNNQAWTYNSASVATVNGATMNDGVRSRMGNRRQPLPDTWMTAGDGTGLGSQAMHPGAQLYGGPGLMGHQLAHMNPSPVSDHLSVQGAGLYGSPDLRRQQDDKKDGGDLIPTAIVIKNIPFNVRKEQLAALMVDLNLPQPYAFNYHFDNGVFRGLAFANFQSPNDTAIVIERMNQLEVGGRKLRVEYKKMLPEHERERIEREKREKRGQLEEQHRPIPLQHQTSIHSLTGASNSAPPRTSPMRDIDLNNPETLGFYTELTLFRNDPNREIFVFPNDITPEQRRQIHILAHNMGFEHQSVGDGEHRQLHVMKRSAAPQIPSHLQTSVSSLDAHRRGLSRAATIDFAESRGMSSSNYHTVGRQGNPTLELPGGSPDGANGINSLRGVKSFADLRSYSPSPSPSTSSYVTNTISRPPNAPDAVNVARYGDYGSIATLGGPSSLTTPTTPGGGIGASDASTLVSTMNSLGLGGFESGAPHGRSQQAPGAIGSQRPGMNGTSNRMANAPERQPRGPEWETSAGFGSRSRANGHMQRGSDSSDAARPGNSAPANTLFPH